MAFTVIQTDGGDGGQVDTERVEAPLPVAQTAAARPVHPTVEPAVQALTGLLGQMVSAHGDFEIYKILDNRLWRGLKELSGAEMRILAVMAFQIAWEKSNNAEKRELLERIQGNG